MVMLNVTSRYGRPCHPASATKYTLCPSDRTRNSPAAQEKQNQHRDFKRRRSHKLPATHKTPLVKCTNLLTKHFLKNPKPNNLPSSTAQLCDFLLQDKRPRQGKATGSQKVYSKERGKRQPRAWFINTAATDFKPRLSFFEHVSHWADNGIIYLSGYF